MSAVFGTLDPWDAGIRVNTIACHGYRGKLAKRDMDEQMSTFIRAIKASSLIRYYTLFNSLVDLCTRRSHYSFHVRRTIACALNEYGCATCCSMAFQ